MNAGTDYNDPLYGISEKQRPMYRCGMGAVELPFLRTKGTRTGEQPDPHYILDEYVEEHERAYKRHLAMLAEYAEQDAAPGKSRRKPRVAA